MRGRPAAGGEGSPQTSVTLRRHIIDQRERSKHALVLGLFGCLAWPARIDSASALLPSSERLS